MSKLVTLGSALPGDAEVNGVDPTAEDLVAEPKVLRTAFVQYDVGKITIDPDTGDKVPTLRVRRFEPLGKSDEVSTAIKEAYFAAVSARTGKEALPLEYAEVIHLPGSDSADDGE